MRDFKWYDYFFTQCRAIWLYVRLFFLPYGQNVDYEFPLSHGLLSHGAIIGLIALIAVSVAAWIYRRHVPLASYGWFTFLILLAPTSSVLPIQDLVVERRLYLPFIGLLLISMDVLRRLPVSRTALASGLACVIAIFAVSRVSTEPRLVERESLSGKTLREVADEIAAAIPSRLRALRIGAMWRCRAGVRQSRLAR